LVSAKSLSHLSNNMEICLGRTPFRGLSLAIIIGPFLPPKAQICITSLHNCLCHTDQNPFSRRSYMHYLMLPQRRALSDPFHPALHVAFPQASSARIPTQPKIRSRTRSVLILVGRPKWAPTSELEPLYLGVSGFASELNDDDDVEEIQSYAISTRQ